MSNDRRFGWMFGFVLVVCLVLASVSGCARGGVSEEPATDSAEVPTETVGVGDTTPPPPPGEGAATIRIQMSGEGYTADYDAWNCAGLEGEWTMRGELDIVGYGQIIGDAAFTMPPRPDSGSWDSLPFSYSMSGTLDAEDAIVDILYEFEDVVFTIFGTDDGPTLGDSRGMAKGTVRVTTPEMSFVVSETYEPLTLVPALIRREAHPECE